jgi:hypothetical protein
MKWCVEVQRPMLPPNHIAGAPLPELVWLEVDEYTVKARDRRQVLELFRSAQASGPEQFKGRTIREIEPLLNGRLPGAPELN